MRLSFCAQGKATADKIGERARMHVQLSFARSAFGMKLQCEVQRLLPRSQSTKRR